MNNVVQLDRPAQPSDGLQTFSSEADRRRLTGAALKAVIRLVDAWDGSNAEGAALLGVSESTWDRMKAGKREGVLSQDELSRAAWLPGLGDLAPLRRRARRRPGRRLDARGDSHRRAHLIRVAALRVAGRRGERTQLEARRVPDEVRRDPRHHFGHELQRHV